MERIKHGTIVLLLPIALFILFPPVSCSSNLSPVFITKVDDNTSGGATFGGGRQLVVENENGIFMTYSRGGHHPPGTAEVFWSLLRSTDGGKTFDLIYTPRLPAGIPALETDEHGNVHLISHDPLASNPPWYHYRFMAERNYTHPLMTRTDGVSLAQKYCTFHDPKTGRMYLFPNQGTLLLLNSTTGKLMDRKTYAGSQGTQAFLQYPHAYVHNGTLYHAWTTQHWKGGMDYVYWDIHFAWSPDGGDTWRKVDGSQLDTPFSPDNAGPTDNIVPREEFDYHTWLNTMTYKEGKVHLAYFSDLPKRHWIHVRIDMATGEIDRRNATGETMTLRGNGGFFATAPGKPLYMVSTNRTHICALVSHDNGETWHDAAVSEKSWNYCVYVFGHRRITSNGITGCFTGRDQDGEYGVYFLRIPLSEEQKPERPDFGFTVKPFQVDILQGESRSAYLTITTEESFQEEMQLSAKQIPHGMNITFHPSSGSGDLTSIINMEANGSAAVGLHDIPVTAYGGDGARNFSLSVNISRPPPSPDFNLTLEPAAASIAPGETAAFEVGILPFNDFTDYSSLSVSGLPQGASASFDPSWGKARYTSNLTLSLEHETPPGTHRLNVTAVGGGNIHHCVLELKVTASIPEMKIMQCWVLLILLLGSIKRGEEV